MNKSFELFDLNDDCLREIFSRLPSIDLCAAKHTCCRFQTIANEVAQKRFKKQLYECDGNTANLKEHTTILKCFGQFVMTMHLSGPRYEKTGEKMQGTLNLLHYCPSLIGLYLTAVSAQRLPVEAKMWGNIRILKFIVCHDNELGRPYIRVMSACKRLQEFGFFGQNINHFVDMEYGPHLLGFWQIYGTDWLPTDEPRKVLYRESSTIKHLTITDIDSGNLFSHLPTPEDLAKLFTLELQSEIGGIAENIHILANTNAKLLNLTVNVPTNGFLDFREIARSLPLWTNLMSYDFHTGFQLPNEIRALFPNLIYGGRSHHPHVNSITYRGYSPFPRYIHRYKWKRDTRFFQDGSDSEPLFREFEEWKKQMKDLGLR